MRIQHNISALNAHRQLGNNNSSVSRNLEKLSSGYRINKAGDDAAGLAISEKMRAQIKGLDTAQKNAQDGISLVQTAEGALTEVHSMLNRMTELATQSANGTYQNETDRENLQKEITSLKKEINRISDGTNYNGIKLLDGDKLGGNVKVDAVDGGTVAATKASFTVDLTDAITGGLANAKNFVIGDGANKVTINAATGAISDNDLIDKIATDIVGQDIDIDSVTYTATFDKTTKIMTFTAKTAADDTVTAANVGAAITNDTTAVATAKVGNIQDGVAGGNTSGKVTLDFKKNFAAGDKITVGDTTYEFVEAGGTASGTNTAITLGATAKATATALKDELDNNAAIQNVVDDGNGKLTFETADDANGKVSKAVAVEQDGGGLVLQIGEDGASYNQVSVIVDDMDTASLGIADVDISTQEGAKAALEKIKDAIDQVSSTRGDLGALQNRLDHTINNLGVASENMSAAESRIRDVDMAKEMMDFTKNNILTQASQAMLAQANQLPQGVLQLLQ